jgi:type II secretory pathway component PulJ
MSAYSVSLSTYRIYLDNQNRDYNFVISNRDNVEQKCRLSITHHNFDKNAIPHMVMGDVLPKNSAVEFFRYSPRNFIIDKFGEQTVRFRLRKKKNTVAQEYRSYLAVNCKKDHNIEALDNNNNAGVSLAPQLVHQVPIIVRPLRLKTQVEITDVTIIEEGESISFDVTRLGERSIFADIELINTQNNKRLDLIKNVAIYPENNKKSFIAKSKGIDSKNILIRLTEDKRTGGSLILEKNVLNN